MAVKTIYTDLDIRFRVGETEFCALNIIYEPLTRSIPGHSHGPGCYEIHYISAGYGRAVIQGTAYRLEPGTVYVTGPGILHAQTSDPADPMCEYCAYLRVLERTTRRKPDPTEVDMHFLDNAFWMGRDTQGVGALFAELFEEFAAQKTGYRIQIESLLQQLPVRMVRCYEEGKPSAHHFSPSSLENSNTVIVEEYFLYEYKNCTLDGLAARLGLSPRQTERLLKKQYGKTFVAMRTQARMAAAATLLLDARATVTDIAAELGYSSIEHFAHAFHAYYGVSARQYRRAQHENIQEEPK